MKNLDKLDFCIIITPSTLSVHDNGHGTIDYLHEKICYQLTTNFIILPLTPLTLTSGWRTYTYF